jgi:tRNA/rRNA methyltransferase
MASRADVVLDRTRVFASTAEALADLHLVVATSARRRDMAKPVWSPARAAAELRAAVAAGQAAGLLFGAERAGLDNDDLARAQAVVEVPANPAFASLNLAQAVLLLGYEWFRTAAPEPGPEAGLRLSPPASAAELDNFLGRLEAALEAAGFFRPPEKRPIMRRTVRNVFARARLSEQEVRTLHGVLSALLREPRD